MKKIISFSLWCQNTPINHKNKHQNKNMYINGAYENLRLQKEKEIYSDWTIRIYYNNTVSKEVIDKLKNLGAELIDMSGSNLPGMFWRFLPINDKDVDIFIVRDVDSRISKREEITVNEFIKSPYKMHVIRDHPHHHYKILGGLWGYKNNLKQQILTDFDMRLHNFLFKRNYKFTRMDDMTFLDEIFDVIQPNNILAHDNFFNINANSKTFFDYEYTKGSYYNYMGEIFDENNIPISKERDIELFQNYKTKMKTHWSSKFWIK